MSDMSLCLQISNICLGGGKHLNSKALVDHHRCSRAAHGPMFSCCCNVSASHVVTFVCFINLSLRWPEDAQKEMSIFKVSDQRTREGILFQRLHQQREAHAALPDAQSDRSPSQNLVSEQEDEGEETEQRPFTVLHHDAPAINTEQRLSLTCSHSPRLHFYIFYRMENFVMTSYDVLFIHYFVIKRR